MIARGSRGTGLRRGRISRGGVNDLEKEDDP